MPFAIRYIAGWIAGTVALFLEPTVRSMLTFAEAGIERATTATTSVMEDATHLPVVGSTIDKTIDMATSAYETVMEKVDDVTNIVNEKVLGTGATGTTSGATGAESLGVAGVGLTPMSGGGAGALTGAGGQTTSRQAATGKHSPAVRNT